ncbi:MAG: glutathione synthase [Deltaproteobacteria bacterium]|jgi:ribosomal protein S6--L-glutamate ligase|nr:glutathione synthase [Deltaproteobacteria bacterium]
MIVSFHPLYEADLNITCAGRGPNADDLAAVQAADAVVLPQGCYRSLYEMARANCRHVFPNYDARFTYPDKIGQIHLFRDFNCAHPASDIFPAVASFREGLRTPPSGRALTYPLVFKLNWGGEGETVFLIESEADLGRMLQKTADFEKSGQSGFLLQEYIESRGRTLRVAVIGRRFISYWRIQHEDGNFYTNLGRGATIDAHIDAALQGKGVALVKQICHKTGINLAGLDVIFPAQVEDPDPMLLEINYFFGRKGLGGSEAYYQILLEEIQAWLEGLDVVK